jgi:hypothetical protein
MRERSGGAGVEEASWPVGTLMTFRNRALVHLWAYVREHGTARVPTWYVSVDGFRRGSSINRCRHRRGQTPDFDAMLESLPGWMWRPSEEVFVARVRLAQEAARSSRLASGCVERGRSDRCACASWLAKIARRKVCQVSLRPRQVRAVVTYELGVVGLLQGGMTPICCDGRLVKRCDPSLASAAVVRPETLDRQGSEPCPEGDGVTNMPRLALAAFKLRVW